MPKANKFLRKAKASLAPVKNKLKKVSKSKYAKDKRVWAMAVAAITLVVFWALPTFAAKAPGQLGYGIKRGEESVVSNLAPLGSWRESLKLDFASNRVAEAAYMANQANQNSHSNQA